MCESLFVNLGGSGGGSIADGVLQTPAALSASLQIVKDNLGNVSPFSLSQNYGAFGGNVIGGAFSHNGAVSVKGLGGNVLSLRNSSDVEKGYFSNAGQMHADNFLSANLGAGSLSGARKMKFGDKAAITDAALTALGLDSQIAIEHNNTVYYIPVSTTQFT
jgi:hypothetical protein